MPPSIPLSVTRPARRSRRDELLAIAAGLFAERGFAGVTVDDIGAAAGVSGPALYHHFESKEAVLGEMLVAISQHLHDQALEAVRGRSGDAALHTLIRLHAQFAVDQPTLITVQFRDLVLASAADQRTVRRLQARYVELWCTELRRSRPSLERRRATAVVHACLGLLNSTPFSSRIAREDMVELLIVMATAALAVADDDADADA